MLQPIPSCVEALGWRWQSFSNSFTTWKLMMVYCGRISIYFLLEYPLIGLPSQTSQCGTWNHEGLQAESEASPIFEINVTLTAMCTKISSFQIQLQMVLQIPETQGIEFGCDLKNNVDCLLTHNSVSECGLCWPAI